MLGAVGIDLRLGAALDLGAKVLVGGREGLRPGCARHAGAQPGQAIDAAVFHVELVRELVDHDIDALGTVVLVEPRQQHRSALPGFAEHFVLVFVQHAGFVDLLARDHEVTRIHDHAHPACVRLQADVEHRQAGLQRDRQQHVVVQDQTLGAVKLLGGEKRERQRAQALTLARVEALQKGQARFDACPALRGDGRRG